MIIYKTLDEMEEHMVRDSCSRHLNCSKKAAEELGISIRKVQYLKKRLGIKSDMQSSEVNVDSGS